ncbi:hypothetical protein RRG08_053648 [Elysia crispata]|uniref:Uncharacterized protein n=1 Tax=Elysia crispata TaxID=231223 RepID=A0AAE1DQK1_9GAST|nr:hypothetical protein RRG08_053648 [Elysia crispata]
MAKTIALVYFFIICGTYTEGFEFTFDRPEADSPPESDGRQVCGVLRCLETLGNAASSSNRTKQLSSFSLYTTQVGGDGTTGRWQKLASLTPGQTDLDRVSDGVRLTGQISDQRATLSIELAKTRDCQEGQFSCVAVSVDNQGHASVKKALVGKAVDLQADFGPQVQPADLLRTAFADVSKTGQPGALAQLMGLKLDWIESRLEGSMKTLQHRLEDEIRDLRAAVTDKMGGLDRNIGSRFGSLELRINNLENRIEDKLDRLDIRRIRNLSQTEISNSDNVGACSLLASKLDALGAKQDRNRKQLNTCVVEVMKLSKEDKNAKANLSDQLTTLTTSMQLFEMNVSSFDDHLEKLETATNQCAVTTSSQENHLTDLVSRVTYLSDLTLDLVSRVDKFKNTYAGGALVPVEEFFDLLGTGKREWRLAFRGTPYINTQVYPAYMYGTGIPVEVEEGCKQFNHSLPCASHYRNRDAFNNWAGIDEVLFAIFKGDQMVHRVTFNAKGSSFTSWFAADRILFSSWKDLTTKNHVVFSIFGEKTTAVQRRFFMNFDYDKGCAGFRGWFYAGDLHGGCAADQTLATPMFRYATGNTLAVWASPASARADSIGIFLKYE